VRHAISVTDTLFSGEQQQQQLLLLLMVLLLLAMTSSFVFPHSWFTSTPTLL